MAEAMNELNKAEVRDEFGNTAYDYLNKTRLRAGMPAISATDVPAGKPLREAILRERAIEFGYEEVRYFDLVRWKRADIFTGQLSRLIIKKAAGEPSGFSYAVSHAMAETRQYAKPEKWNDKYFLLPLPIDEINKTQFLSNSSSYDEWASNIGIGSIWIDSESGLVGNNQIVEQ